MGADGWLGVGWPKEYGGQGRGHVEQFMFFDESMRAGAPVPMLTINTVGPTIMQFGTEEQKQRLPAAHPAPVRSTSASATASPGAGTDLAALRATAVRDGDEYVINGSEAVDQPRRRAPITAGSPSAPAPRPRSTGHLDDHRADGHARHHRAAARADGRAARSPRCTTTTCGCPPKTSSAARTTAGSSSPTSSTTSGSRSAAPAWSRRRCSRSASGPLRRCCPTAAG